MANAENSFLLDKERQTHKNAQLNILLYCDGT